MKDRVDKSMGIVTRIAVALTRIKPTDPLRLGKREAHKKRNCSDFSGNSPVKIRASQFVLEKQQCNHVSVYPGWTTLIVCFLFPHVVQVSFLMSTSLFAAG